MKKKKTSKDQLAEIVHPQEIYCIFQKLTGEIVFTSDNVDEVGNAEVVGKYRLQSVGSIKSNSTFKEM